MPSKKSDPEVIRVAVIHPGFDRPLTVEEAEAVRKLSYDPGHVSQEVEAAFESRGRQLQEEAAKKKDAETSEQRKERLLKQLEKAKAARAEKKKRKQEVQDGLRETVE